MASEFDEAELENALNETEFLHRLGGQSFNPTPRVPAPILTPTNPWTAVGPGNPYATSAPPDLAPSQARTDSLRLDGTKQAALGGRTFELTDAEMSKVMSSIEKAYARAMRGELTRVRESVFGSKSLRKMQKTGSATYAQDLRGMPRPGLPEITYPDTPPEREMPLVRKRKPRQKKVSPVPSAEPTARIALSDPLSPLARRAAKAGVPSNQPLQTDGPKPSPIAEGGGLVAGGSG